MYDVFCLGEGEAVATAAAAVLRLESLSFLTSCGLQQGLAAELKLSSQLLLHTI